MPSLAVWSVNLTFSVAFIPTKSLRTVKPAFVRSETHLGAGSSKDWEYALLFDCDGVILETEELHRRAYNAAFREFDLKIDDEPVEWSVSVLQYRLQVYHVFFSVRISSSLPLHFQ